MKFLLFSLVLLAVLSFSKSHNKGKKSHLGLVKPVDSKTMLRYMHSLRKLAKNDLLFSLDVIYKNGSQVLIDGLQNKQLQFLIKSYEQEFLRFGNDLEKAFLKGRILLARSFLAGMRHCKKRENVCKDLSYSDMSYLEKSSESNSDSTEGNEHSESVSSGDMSGDMSYDMSGDMSGDMSYDMSGDMSYDMSGDMSGDTSGDMSYDMSGDMSGDMSYDMSGDMSGDMSSDMSSDMFGDMSDMSGDIFDMSGDMSGDMSNMSGDMSGDISGDMYDMSGYMSDMSGYMSGDISVGMSGDISGDMSGMAGMSGDMSDMPGDISGDMSDMSGNNFDHMSGDLSEREVSIDSDYFSYGSGQFIREMNEIPKVNLEDKAILCLIRNAGKFMGVFEKVYNSLENKRNTSIKDTYDLKTCDSLKTANVNKESDVLSHFLTDIKCFREHIVYLSGQIQIAKTTAKKNDFDSVRLAVVKSLILYTMMLKEAVATLFPFFSLAYANNSGNAIAVFEKMTRDHIEHILPAM